jgi:UDP-N-acetylmuramoyl-tripeptide--D-alanyl-D-alanine ligase
MYDDLYQIPDVVVKGSPSGQTEELPIRGISIDTRTLKPREIFWAIKGESTDGHWFVNDAENRGAIAAVIEKSKAKKIPEVKIPLILVRDTLESLQQLSAWHRNRFDIPLIAITGTNGKTTTKEMIAWILQTKYKLHKTISNFNNHIGMPLTLLRMTSEHQISVIELGTNHPGEIKLLSSLARPTAALITNIGRGHLEFFSNLDGVAREKLSLFRSLKPNGLIFLNRDDKKINAARIRRKYIQDYSFQEKEQTKVKGQLIKINSQGYGIWKLNNHTKIRMNVPGIQNVQNALAASAVGLHFGISENIIKETLEGYSAYDKRMQIIKNGSSVIINDTYNANPDSFKPALETLSHLAKGKQKRKIVVIGDMLELGDKSDSMHRDLFMQLTNYSIEAVFALGKSCKSASEHIIKKGFMNVFVFDNHEELASSLKKYLKSGDVILLKGSRGMQMEKVLAYL